MRWSSRLVDGQPNAGCAITTSYTTLADSTFAETMRRLDMIQLLHAGDMAAALYDAELPGGAVRFAEFFQVGAGNIRSLKLLYDATEYRARGGR